MQEKLPSIIAKEGEKLLRSGWANEKKKKKCITSVSSVTDNIKAMRAKGYFMRRFTFVLRCRHVYNPPHIHTHRPLIDSSYSKN